MSTQPKTGPITRDELLALWQQSVDPLYAQPFVDHPDTSGLEAHEQAMEQLARVSRAIDTTTQAMFLLPWSGQSGDPARGENAATATVSISRALRIGEPLVLDTDLFIEEVTTDWGENGGVPVVTGRRFHLVQPLVFNPGEAGPFQVQIVAERAGYGYNNPSPGDLVSFAQPGNTLANAHANFLLWQLTVPNRADVVVPDHVGQYVVATSGANISRAFRAVGYLPPDPSIDVGGRLKVEKMGALEGTITGTFKPGELVVLRDESGMPPIVLATGVLARQSANGAVVVVSLVVATGAVTASPLGQVHLRGQSSGADLLVSAVLLDPAHAVDNDMSWAILDWVKGWGLTIDNPTSPVNGRSGMLDALGLERNLPRSPNEDDDHFRKRIAELGDVVSPNAIRRAANRILGPLGFGACLREVGLELLPGFYFDHDPFDDDFAQQPTDRFKLWLDYVSFRAFFLIGVPPLDWGEFGFAYDAGPSNAYDAAPALAFYDGYPVTAAQIYRSVWQAVNAVKAGGVGFDLYQEKLGCF